MIPIQKPLRLSKLTEYDPAQMTEAASERARRRLRDEMAKRHLSQRDLAGILGWSQARVSKNLNGRVQISVDDLDAMCFAVSIQITEAVRDHGLEFCAEMTPTELRLLERLRELPEDVRNGLMGLLGLRTQKGVERRGATPSRDRVKTGR